MNPTISALEQRYPLSPRKFWKKLIPKIFGAAFASVVAGIIGGVIAAAIAQGDSDSFVVWFSTIAVSLLIVITVLNALYISAYIKRYYYSADEDFITIKKGVFAPTEIHVQYRKIQDVYVDQDIFDRMLGIYDVHIASATVASGIEAHIDGVDAQAAEGLKMLFLNAIKSSSVPVPAPAVRPAPQATAVPVAPGTFSSETYPVSGRWIYRKLIGSAFGSALASLIAVWILFAQGKNGGPSLAEIISFGSFGDGLALFIGLALLLFIYQIIYLNVWKKNYRFEFTPEFVYMRRGFIGMSETHVPYGTIQDVIVRQGVLDRVFGLYDVVIQNAASVVAAPRRGRGGGAVAIGSRGPTIPGQPLEPATKLADFVKSVALSKNSGITGL